MRLRSRSRGFTLIEILVVVTIVGIVLSIAVLSLDVLGDDRDLTTEARRLAALMQVARDESMIQGREFGIEFTTDAYRFVEFDPLTGQWAEIVGDETLRLRELPEDVEFDLWLDEQRVVLEAEPAKLGNEDEDEDEENGRGVFADYAPHVFIFSSGDVTPFELTVFRHFDEQSVTLESDLTGQLEIITDEAELP